MAQPRIRTLLGIGFCTLLLAGCGRASSAARATEWGSPGTVVATTDDVPRVSATELKRLIDAGGVLVIDVRSAESYQERHIVGAVSMTAEQLEKRFTELPRDRGIVLY